uniref:Phosphoinositide phospholipase C n=1 Tax=Globodera rostochiensis TaxID=31243 RepID=A0A914HLY3_GLORO
MAPVPVGAGGGGGNICRKRSEHGKCGQPSTMNAGGVFAKGAKKGDAGGGHCDKASNGGAGGGANGQHAALDSRDFCVMEKGHRVCKLFVSKKFDIVFRHLWLNMHTHQIVLTKLVNEMPSGDEPGPSTSSALGLFMPNGLLSNAGRKTSAAMSSSECAKSPFCSPYAKSQMLDLRLVKEVQVLSKAVGTMQIAEKWRRDSSLQTFDADLILVVQWGAAFVLNSWLILFNTKEACQLWCRGVQQLCADHAEQSHALVVERWLRKRFFALLPHPTSAASVSIKHMKPFVQQRLQCKVNSKQLQEITEGEMGFESFVLAHNHLLNFHALFESMFSEYTDSQNAHAVSFQRFVDFLRDIQHDGLGQSKQLTSDFLRRYLRDVDPDRDVPEPSLHTDEFMEYLFSPENSLFDPVNYEVVHDMGKPLNHYWISSSHNTYLTGDQLRSESSLDAYARALLMGCRCVELDCWDGHQLNVVVIYHGYTMTSKLQLRDVLRTIREYAFRTSEFPLILSIEDNCSLPAQRQMAVDIKLVLGDLLLTAPVSRDEWQLPSPAALRRKIILKHKKLQLHNDTDAVLSAHSVEDELEQDNILSRRCTKKGVLWLREDGTSGSSANANANGVHQQSNQQQWHKHIFDVPAASGSTTTRAASGSIANDGTSEFGTLNGRGIANGGQRKLLAGREDSLNSQSDDTYLDESAGPMAADACADAHVAEEWFHGKVDREEAKARLLAAHHNGSSGGGTNDGLFLVRESTTFIGDFTLSFVHGGGVHHCRIKASISTGGERKYHLLDSVKRDTLYELISFYTRNALDTPNFKTYLQTPCPQPQPHLGKPWFSAHADTEQAEKLLNAVPMDGAFLVRYSSTDKTVFVVSLRIDNKLCHYRLKREGRLFVMAQRMFDSLCQLVDFYAENPFVRGVSLKFPINEQTISQYTDQNGGQLQLDGFYVDLNNLDKEFRVEAIESFDGVGDEHQLSSLEFKRDQQQSFSPLSFPIGAHITVLSMDKNDVHVDNDDVDDQKNNIYEGRWVGRHNDKTGWFPAKCVRKLGGATNGATDSSNNTLNYGTIELAGTTFKQCEDSDPDDRSRCGSRPFAFRITLAQSHWDMREYVLAADSREELDEWLCACQQMAANASDKMRQLRSREKQSRIASELSSLVIYCQAVPFNADFELQDSRTSFYEMCSFSESKHDKLVERGLQLFNKRQLSRVYPQASRFTSTNFSPMPMWNSGCHMVALNFQTGDKSMQLNAGRFMANGCCGYVLKPRYLMDETFAIGGAREQQQQQQQMFNPPLTTLNQRPSLSSSTFEVDSSDKLKKGVKQLNDEHPKMSSKKNGGTFAEDPSFGETNSSKSRPVQSVQHQNHQRQKSKIELNIPQSLGVGSAGGSCPIALSVLVIAGRHLSRSGACDKGGGICSPCVELELLGFTHDARTLRTNTITSNGLNPVWQERFVFHVRHPEMALLRFHVEDGDFVGPKTDPFIGQAVFSLDSVRSGFRSVPLRNQFSEPLELSALLVHVEIRTWEPPFLHGIGFPTSSGRRSNSNSLPSSSSSSSMLSGLTTTFGQHGTLNHSKSIDKAAQQQCGPPIHNPHKLLQAGRSILAPERRTSLVIADGISSNSAAAAVGANEEIIGQHLPPLLRGPLNRNGSLETAPSHQQMNSLNSRSISVESGDNVKPLLSSARKTGTNTLRRIFRLGGKQNDK